MLCGARLAAAPALPLSRERSPAPAPRGRRRRAQPSDSRRCDSWLHLQKVTAESHLQEPACNLVASLYAQIRHEGTRTEPKPFPTDGATAASPCSGARCFIRSARRTSLAGLPRAGDGSSRPRFLPTGLVPSWRRAGEQSCPLPGTRCSQALAGLVAGSGLPRHMKDSDDCGSAPLLLGHCWAARRPQAAPRPAEIPCDSTRTKQCGKHLSQKENARLPPPPRNLLLVLLVESCLVRQSSVRRGVVLLTFRDASKQGKHERGRNNREWQRIAAQMRGETLRHSALQFFVINT